MEAAGLAVGVAGLAALFGQVVRCWGFVSAHRSFAQEFALQQTKLDIEKTLFLQWGRRTGIVRLEGESETIVDPRISDDSPETQKAVKHILLAMKKLVTDSEELRIKYGITSQDESDTGAGGEVGPRVSRGLMEAFDDWQRQVGAHQREATAWRKTRWVCRDRDKFITFVNEMNYLNLKLDALTPLVPFIQQMLANQIIEGIRTDLSALRLVRLASTNWHRGLSGAASEQISRSEAQDESAATSNPESTAGGRFETMHQITDGIGSSALPRRPTEKLAVPKDILDIIDKIVEHVSRSKESLKYSVDHKPIGVAEFAAIRALEMRLNLQKSKLKNAKLSQLLIDQLRLFLKEWPEDGARLEQAVRWASKSGHLNDYDGSSKGVNLRPFVGVAINSMLSNVDYLVANIIGKI